MEKDTEQLEQAAPKEDRKIGGKVRKAFSIALDVVLYLFLAFSIVILIISVASKQNQDGAVGFFGHEMRIVTSSSMEKSEYSKDVSGYAVQDLPLRSMIFVERVPDNAEEAYAWYSKLQEGDVLTFRYVMGSSQETVTHRITKIVPTATGFIISLQGDNRSEGGTVSTQTIYTSSDDYPTQNEVYNYVIGKVTGVNTALGYMVYAIKQPVGTALIIIVPCCIIIIWQIVRIFTVLGEDRKKKAAAEIEKAKQEAAEQAEERDRQARELEELKKKFAELEQKQTEQDGGGDDASRE